MNLSKTHLVLLVAVSFGFMSQQAVASNDAIANGKKLYQQGCTSCHNTEIHTRPNKIIFSKKAIIKRVKFCDSMAGSNFNDQQISDIAEYLNATFYKYDD